MFVDEHRDRFGVEPICRTLEISASAYYERQGGRRSARAVEDERLPARISEIHEADSCARGYRRTWIALRWQGEEVGRGRVQRLMRGAGIQGAKRRARPGAPRSPIPMPTVAPTVIDAFSRRVVGRQLASHMRTDLVLDTLRMALGQRPPGADFGLVAHTDRGSRYTSAAYTQELDDHGASPPWARSATPMTTRWPRASSSPSRPSWSPTGSGAPFHS